LKRLAPDIIIVRYWLPLMGPSLGTVIRIAKKNRHTKVIAITDNVIPHEKRIGDVVFTRYFLGGCDAFVTMSEKVMKDLQQFVTGKPAIQVPHPLYDHFGEPVPKLAARQQLGLAPEDNLLLFFGFIRKYKGLDILLDALHLLKNQSSPVVPQVKLLVAGEFYEEEAAYQQKIDALKIRDMLVLRTGFIPEEEVKYIFGAADVVVQPYRNATQSGVTPLAYHFEKPMIVTRVGALADYVPDGKAGIVCEPEAPALAAAIATYFSLGEAHFIPHLREEKKKYSWHTLVNALLQLATAGR
jgi:glycosyltransferase involved in cell wall biosynthesis